MKSTYKIALVLTVLSCGTVLVYYVLLSKVAYDRVPPTQAGGTDPLPKAAAADGRHDKLVTSQPYDKKDPLLRPTPRKEPSGNPAVMAHNTASDEPPANAGEPGPSKPPRPATRSTQKGSQASLPPILTFGRDVDSPPADRANGPSLSSITFKRDRPFLTATPSSDAAKTAAGSSSNPHPRKEPQKKKRTYTIRQGDTLSSIAVMLYGSQHYSEYLSQANPLVDPKRLKVGQIIRLPSLKDLSKVAINPYALAPGQSAHHMVRSGETLSTISQRYYRTTELWKSIYDANRENIGQDPHHIKVGLILKIPRAPHASLEAEASVQ